MSLLLTLLHKNQQTQLNDLDEESSGSATTSAQKSSAWLISYIALFTSLLAFFILTISLLNLEASAPKRNFENLVHKLEKQFKYEAKQESLDWLQIEANTTKGVRISFPKNLILGQSLFNSASAQINPRYLPYLRSLLPFFEKFNTAKLRAEHETLIKKIEPEGYELKFIWRIEGHTDANAMAENARFRSNVELSAFRAYAVMDWLRIRLSLTQSEFAIAGYGSFQPISDNPLDSENRRIEIYLLPQLVPKVDGRLAGKEANDTSTPLSPINAAVEVAL